MITDETGPLADVRALITAAGIAGRRPRTVVRLLVDRAHTLASLVRESAADRRTVEAILAAIGADLDVAGDRMRIGATRVRAYRDLIGYDQLLSTQPADPLGRRLADSADLVTRVDRWIADAPRSRHALDHVSATAETAVRRALWLDSTFDLAGARLLCVGDHDLTSLATASVNPDVSVTVVDVDERLLEFIDTRARQGGLAIRCLYADLRFGLAGGAVDWGDLVMTDPPYTPEGVRLFLGRGLEGLRDRDHARLVMAYGFGENHPALGLKVQQAVGALHLVYEAVLPDFSRYHGAQAVGGSSDLYVLRPTARSWRTAEQAGPEQAAHIYTHGPQSVEGRTASLAPDVVDAVLAAAAGPQGYPPAALVGDGWPRPQAVTATAVADTLALGTVLAGGLPAHLDRGPSAVAVDLSGDPGGWLVRLLLAVDAQRLAVLVPNNHPDLADEAGQRGLAALLASRYRLRFRRSTPGPHLALVEADRIDAAELDPPQRVVRRVLDRPHGKIANTWREALIRVGRTAGGETPTKNEVRALISTVATAPEVIEERLIDLPRHQIRTLIADVAASAGPVFLSPGGDIIAV